MTEADWRQRLAAVHPDRGGDVAVFVALSAAREAWRQQQPGVCAWCGQPFMPRAGRRATHKCCGWYCSNNYLASQRQKRIGVNHTRQHHERA